LSSKKFLKIEHSDTTRNMLERAVIICVAPSKKKNFEAVNVLITIMILAAITARSPIMFIARITLRMMKPGPASRLLVRGILGERFWLRKDNI